MCVPWSGVSCFTQLLQSYIRNSWCWAPQVVPIGNVGLVEPFCRLQQSPITLGRFQDQLMSSGDLVSTPSFKGTCFSILSPLITPFPKSPLETPSIPWAIIRVLATHMRWMNNSPAISNFHSRRIRLKSYLLLDVPLK